MNEIKQALCKYGPISASLKVTKFFQAYTGGVFDEKGAVTSDRDSNHAIVITGWDDSKRAFLIKNSWGEKGYMWIEYGCNNIGNNAAWIRLK